MPKLKSLRQRRRPKKSNSVELVLSRRNRHEEPILPTLNYKKSKVSPIFPQFDYNPKLTFKKPLHSNPNNVLYGKFEFTHPHTGFPHVHGRLSSGCISPLDLSDVGDN